MPTTTEYVLANASADEESVRLRFVEASADPHTRRRLAAIGIEPGAQVAEVGAGRGSLVRRLAAFVGPTGRVLAADLDPRFLTDMPENVEVRAVDIRSQELDPNAYDLLHCRYLQLRLPPPHAALCRMASALRPGGIILVEYGDLAASSLVGQPDAEWCTNLIFSWMDSLAK